MSELETSLKPVSGSHSITEAVITLFLANPIIKPDRFEVLIKNQFKDKFQKFEKVSQVQFQFRGKDGGAFESSQPQITENIGFKFQRFEEGKIVTALQGMNEGIRNFISYHTLNYTDWDIFFPDFKKVFSVLSNFHGDLFVNAFSLHYVDEFEWVAQNDIDTKKIFNQDSTVLPEEFFKCRLNNYQFTTVKKNKYEYFDRLEIRVDERPKKFITISHNIVVNYNDSIDLKELIHSSELEDELNYAHLLNKQTLVNILNKDVCDLIKLSI